MAHAVGVYNGNFRNGDYVQYVRELAEQPKDVKVCASCGNVIGSRPLWMVGKYDICYSCYEEKKHAIEQATAIEAPTKAEQVAAEVQSDNQWLDSEPVRRDEYNIPLDLIERHNAKVKADIFTRDPNCQHERAFPTYGGMMCRCGAKFDARNEFEQRLVNARNPKGSGYVNWQLR